MKLPAQGIVGREALREAAAKPDLRQVMDLVRAAIDAKVNVAAPAGNEPVVSSRKWFDTEAFYADRMVIVLDGRCWSYPYTIDGTTVTLGEPQEVVETYTPLKESAPLRLAEAEGGTVWEAVLIRAGASENGVFYSDAVLREAVPLFDGARIFVKGDVQHIKGEGKDVRQIAGWVDGPRFIEGAAPDTGRIVATARLHGLPEETRTLFVEAAKAGRHDLVGLSIDVAGKVKRETRAGKPMRVATKFSKVNSVDLIVEPGAGGGLVRLVEAADPAHSQEDSEMSLKQLMLEAIKAKNPAKAAAIDINTIGDDELETAYREAVAAPAPAAAPAQGGFATVEDLRMIEARATARVRIAESTLPGAAKDKLRADFEQRTRFAEADVDAAIKGEREYLARFTESGHVRLGSLDIQVEDRGAKMAGMLDAFFDPAHKDHRNVGSFRECYVEFTGDRLVTGRIEHCDRSRLREASGGNFREALDSTSWADALGNSITRRMQAAYTGEADLQAWRRVATVGRVADFRTQERFRTGGYGNLPAVAQGAAYAALTSPGDDKATYGATKRGGLETITREMILADDVNAIQRIPGELALAAGNTLYEFVFDFFRSNPTIYDGVALYHADHGNLFATALSSAEYSTHRLAMLKQSRAGSAKRMAVAPGIVLVPFDQEEKAFDMFHRDTNLDPSFVQSLKPQVIAVSYWTDTGDWCTVAPTNRLPVLEISFVNGQEEPELFVQDMPNVGSMFSNDQLTYKIRHEYGGCVLVDGEKGTTKAVVA